MVQLADRLRELGQMPFYPPNVKGWDGGRTWIDSSTLLGPGEPGPHDRRKPGDAVRRRARSTNTSTAQSLKSSAAIVDWLSELLVAVPLASGCSRAA